MSLDRLETLRSEMKKCVRCSLCKLIPMPTIQETRFTSACPPVDEYHFHAYCGGGLQVMALSLLDERIEVDQDLAHIVAACTTCGMCDVACKFIMAAERQDVIMALKEHLVECGQVLPGQQVRSENLESYGYSAGKPMFAPGEWAQGLGVKTLPGDRADLLLYAGAGTCQDERHIASARRLAQLLQIAGVDFGILAEDEPDSGIEVYWTGQRKIFEKQADHVVDILDQTSVNTIVTLCGEDLGMLRGIYPTYGCEPRAKVLHASEYLLHLIQRGKLRLSQPILRKVTYHDPCYLGRQSEPAQAWQGEERRTHGVMTYFVPPKPINYGVNGVFDAPRQLLHLIPGIELHEMQRIREYAYCCGGGGGVPDTHPNVARSAALQRIEEASTVGAEVLITACQHCRHNLTRWQEDSPLPVLDLVDIVHEAAGLNQSDMESDPERPS
ncbi:MAG: (Fe-S)-binding protein [Anaerolineales bacterium]|nr:(Fe-S)-binding protein [Anaerolineales bacterium]